MSKRGAYYREMLTRLRSGRAWPLLYNYLKYRALPRRAKTAVRRYAPQIASVWVTLRCNLSCNHCSVSKLLEEKENDWRASEVGLKRIKELFSNPLLAYSLLVDLQGGEPLLVEDLDRIVAYLTSRGHLTNFSTNGLLLSRRIRDVKQAGVSRINVSFYEENRDVLERDMEEINRIFPVHASMILFKSALENEPERLLERVRFIHRSGCLSLRFWIYRPMGKHPRPQEIITVGDQAYVDFKQRVESEFPNFCLWPSAVQKPPYRKLCPQLWQRINVDGLGNMGICCGMDTKLPGPHNNIFEDDPDVVFNHPLLVRMRQQFLDPNSEPPNICKTCNLLGFPGW